MTRLTFLLGTATVAVVAALIAGAALAAPTHGHAGRGATPVPPPSEFSARVDNEWFPLLPGTRWVYVGVKDGQPTRDVVTVTDRTKEIAGVPCVAVHDLLYVRGGLGERTTDWYSQDSAGNVWYFGEKTAELDRHGRVTSTEGSWHAGVDGAEPGIFMPARPRLGQSYRQEYLKGQAEDHFRVIGLFVTVTGSGTKNALLTKEWTPLEPGVIDHKVYVRGLGNRQRARAWFRPVTTTSAPRVQAARAVASPIPDVPPMAMMSWPLRFIRNLL